MENASHPYLNEVFPKDGSHGATEVDVIAVHGLDTSSPKTWTAYERDGDEATRGRAINWLSDEDMLPSVIPKASIWTFDYNANYHANASVADLLALGEVFLRSISEMRKSVRPVARPLMFIGSCFGGLVVVKALESASITENGFRDILEATAGIIFLGTPLRGTRAGKAAQWRVMLEGIRGHEVSDSLIKDLDESSGVLRNLIQRFSSIANTLQPQLKITCFYETRKTRILNAVFSRSVTRLFPGSAQILVDQESACIDGHRQIPLDLRHAMMNKYRGPKDQNFMFVSDCIRGYVEESYNTLQAKARLKNIREKQQDWQDIDKEFKCHQLLRTSDYERHKERNPDRVEGTCRWFFGHPNYQSWREGKTSGLLWVSGDPGCGKSVLSKSLLNREIRSTESLTSCYFFFKDDNVEQRSATAALCAILHQLFEQKEALIKYAMPGYRHNGIELPRLFSELWDILTKATLDPDAGEVICVIDALDECEGSGRVDLIRALNGYYDNSFDSPEKNTRLKFLITSRPYFYIERDFNPLTSKVPAIRLAGEAETESISREIDLVIKVEVQKLAQTLNLEDSVRFSLEEELLRNGNRTYLWLYLILDVIRHDLESVSPNQLRRIIHTLPDTVDKAYTAILERSDNIGSATKLLHIIVAAQRPLTLREMSLAMAVEESSTSYEDLDLVGEEQYRIIVRNLCGLFVSVIDSKIYLIHQTAREFLIFNQTSIQQLPPAPMESSSRKWKSSLKPEKSNLILAQACIWYLLFTVFESHPLIQKIAEGDDRSWEDTLHGMYIERKGYEQYTTEHYFLDYAAQHWAVHFREAKVAKQTALCKSVALKVCETRNIRFSTWFIVYWSKFSRRHIWPKMSTELMVASYFSLEDAVQLLLELKADVNCVDTMGRTPLSWAAMNGHEAVVKLLLDWNMTVDLKINSGTSVDKATAKKRKRSMQSVSRRKLHINRRNTSGQPSFSSSTTNEHDTTISLSDKKAIIDIIDCRGQTPLSLAAETGHEAVVKLLLERNANIEHQTTDGYTALSLAAKWGYDTIVKLLLERNVNIDHQIKDGSTALSLAAEYGHDTIVKLLLERNANIEHQDQGGYTALSIAARRGHKTVVKLLIERNANIESKTEDGSTALSLATDRGHKAVAGLLIEHKRLLESGQHRLSLRS